MTSETQYPIPAKRPVTRSFHGDDFVDDYEWFREEHNPEVLAHIKAENDWYDARTAHLAPLRKQIVGEIASYTKEDDVSAAVRKGDFWYWSRTWEGKSYAGQFRCAVADYPLRPNPDEVVKPTLLYDANELAQGHEFFSIGSEAVSADGRLCALAIDNAGGESFRLRIHDVESGLVVDDAVQDATYGLAFSPDARFLYYSRSNAAWRSYQVWQHEVGADPATDVLLYQEDDELYSVFFGASRDEKWLVVASVSTLTTQYILFDLANPTGGRRLEFPRRFGLEYQVEPAGERIFITHNLQLPDFEVAVIDVPAEGEAVPEPEAWPQVYAPRQGERVNGVSAFRDFAVVEMRIAGSTALQVLQLGEAGEANLTRVPTAEAVTVEFVPAENWDSAVFLYSVESLLRPLQVVEYTVETGQSCEIKVTEVPGFDASQYVEYREWATADDGTRIPLTIVHHKDVQRDGTNAGLLYGYGSYEVSMEPWFGTMRIPIFSRHVVYAIAHIRGGGELGRAWYEDGKLLNKRNTFTDFVTCADYLIDSGLVAPGRLAAEGRSAGGLLMGAITNLAPQTFAVVHAGVPFVDALTTILKPELPLTIGEWEEWGNPIESAEVYEYMKSYSPYENITAQEYPAILATTSINDVRVSFVEPTKWIAKLRETVSNDQLERPILQRTEMVAGHRGGSGRYKEWEDRAHELAFIFSQLEVQ